MTEDSLINHCIKGSRYHQRVLFEKYYKMAYNKAYSYLSNKTDTEDAVVIGFNQVFMNLNKFEKRGERSFQNWILTIIINAAIKILKSKKILFATNELDTKVHLEPDDDEDIDMDSVQKIYEIMEEMPKGYKLVFMMYVIEGYRHKEIAKYLDITVNTSKSQLSKAKAYIRKKIKLVEHE